MLDFSKRKKKYWDVALHNGTKLQIPCPTMDVYDSMVEISKNPYSVDYDQLKEAAATVMKSNRQGTEITDEDMRLFDLDDLKEFFIEYGKWVKQVLSDPN